MSHGVCDESEQNHDVYVNCALHSCAPQIHTQGNKEGRRKRSKASGGGEQGKPSCGADSSLSPALNEIQCSHAYLYLVQLIYQTRCIHCSFVTVMEYDQKHLL